MAAPALPDRAPASVQVDAAAYLSVARVERILPALSIALSDHAYLPRLDDLAADWVAHVAVPAFREERRRRGGGPVPSFCSIGTGSGLDVLCAVEVLGARRVGLTDVHEDVVAIAVENVRRNCVPGSVPAVEAGAGDLLGPLQPLAPRYDVIYENLPNLPAATAAEVADARRSSTHLAPRREVIPDVVRTHLLDLHYLALGQARAFLASGGAVLSTLGARVPLDVFLRMGAEAGLRSSIFTYGWKVQAEPASVLADHAARERAGAGPFTFYRASALEQRFAGFSPAAAGQRARELEGALAAERLDARTAHRRFLEGERIGHTVVVLRSEAA